MAETGEQNKNPEVKNEELEDSGEEKMELDGPEKESTICYCGKERKLGTVELLCGVCQRFFHSDCVTCYLGKVIPFMTNYQFFCKQCNPNGLESFTKKQATFSQMCYTAVANLMYENPDKTMFSRDKDIIQYIETHWENLTTVPRRIKLTWHTTVHKTMTKEYDIFSCNELTPGDPCFGLVNQDLSKIAPNYENLFKTAAPLFKQDYKMGVSLGDTKTRGTKRKVPDGMVPLGIKQKRGRPPASSMGWFPALVPSRPSDIVPSSKMVPHGYPSEHPFNKDGYRYVLAEPDPHAPNRQAFDESIEWAGKPIPGYLYRKWLEPEVLLALHDRAPQLKVSEDRLTVSGEKGYSMIRATHGISFGNWYYEAIITEMPLETAARIGWTQALGNLQAPSGYDKFSYSWRSIKGTRFHQSCGKHYAEKGYKEGDILGFYISMPKPKNMSKVLPISSKDKPLVKFKSHLYFEEKDYVKESEMNLKTLPGSKMIMFKNGRSQGEAWVDEVFEGTYYPCVSLFKNASVTLNFGPEFKHPPKGLKEDWKPLSEMAQEATLEHTVADMLYHIEHEGELPEF